MNDNLSSFFAKSVFNNVVEFLYSVIDTFPDKREGKNTRHSIRDAALGAFSIFFTQSPSFLAYQDAMQKVKGHNNAKSLFGINNIISDNHIRDLLDEVCPENIFPVFRHVFEIFLKTGLLDSFRSYNNNLLCALDGVHFHSSQNVHCDFCNQKQHKNGKTTYFHSVITPVIVKPGKDKVIALEPEFIMPQDGSDKEDCENTAAKRWLSKYGEFYKGFKMTILGDDLYCKQPLCAMILDLGFDFILTCKPESHSTLYEYITMLKNDIETVEVKRWTGRRYEIDTYRFYNGVPLRNGEDALEVNWCELTTTLENKEMLYRNSFATNFRIIKENVKDIVADGRARWKIENENNNVLKTKGYNLEHNFGHGKKYLANLFLAFNILAFLFHTLLHFLDKRYQLLRNSLPTRKTFFDDVRALTRYMYFENWDHLLIFMIKGLELDDPGYILNL